MAIKEKSAYSVLGLHKGASQEEIKHAYVNLVKKYDPERHTDRFMLIQKAFDKLKDPVQRAREDLKTFNYIKGTFSFNESERKEMPEAQINQGIAQLEKAINDGSASAEETAPKLIQGYMLRSFRKVKRKLWAEAIQDWEFVLKIDPTHVRAKNNMLHSFMTLGYSYANHGLFEEAIEVWGRAAQMDSDNHLIIHNLALACDFAGEKDEAARYWRETVKRWKALLERHPEDEYLKNLVIEFHRQYGDSVSEGGPASGKEADAQPSKDGKPAAAPPKRAQSIADYQEILRLNPDDFEARFKVASKYMEEQKWNEAIADLKILAQKHSKNIEILNLMGWAMLNSGQIDKAFMVWNKAHTIDKNNPTVIESIIKARMAMGRKMRQNGLYTQALVHFKALLRLIPQSDEVYAEIGLTYHAQNNEREAYRNYQKSLELNPKNKDARTGVTTLKLRR